MTGKVAKSIRVDPELWKQAKIKALGDDLTLEELIDRLLREYTEKEG